MTDLINQNNFALSTVSADTLSLISALQPQDLSLGETDTSTFAIPYLSLIQALSPVLTEGLNESAKVGMFYNTVSKKVYNTVEIIPCYFQRRYTRFDSQRNFKGVYNVADIENLRIKGVQREQDGLNYTIEGDRLVDSRIHYVLAKGEGESTYEPCIINLSSTQIKQSKNLMCMLRNMEITAEDGSKIKPPCFISVFKVQSFTEKNEKGTWKSWNFTFKEFIGDKFNFTKAKAFYDSVRTNQISAENINYEYEGDTAHPTAPQAQGFNYQANNNTYQEYNNNIDDIPLDNVF